MKQNKSAADNADIQTCTPEPAKISLSLSLPTRIKHEYPRVDRRSADGQLLMFAEPHQNLAAQCTSAHN